MGTQGVEVDLDLISKQDRNGPRYTSLRGDREIQVLFLNDLT